jgi:hypothetical protein
MWYFVHPPAPSQRLACAERRKSMSNFITVGILGVFHAAENMNTTFQTKQY